jgi:serine/threonine protein kinase
MRSSQLLRLPVHRAIYEKADPDTILEGIEQHGSTLMSKDYDGRTALAAAIACHSDSKVILGLLSLALPFDLVTAAPIGAELHEYSWIKFIQRDEHASVVESVLDEYPQLCMLLGQTEDELGRKAVNIASGECQRVMRESTYLFKRYEVLTLQNPHHKSATCIIHIAIDHGAEGGEKQVALKFMSHRDQFDKEVSIREAAGLDPKYVISILRTHNGDEDGSFLVAMRRLGFDSYPYCLVMEKADRNLQVSVLSDGYAGKDWEKIRTIARQLCHSVEHLHDHRIVHGDIKPLNAMRCEDRFLLIDLDASRVVGEGFAANKVTTAYVPPEMVYVKADGSAAVKMSSESSVAAAVEYNLVRSHYSQDVWALGCTLFELFTGSKMFLTVSGHCLHILLLLAHSF